MRSTKLQLLMTLAAVLTSAALFAAKGLPPVVKIHTASWTGDMESIRRAANWGVDLNAVDSYGLSPLHLATMTGRKEVVALLVARGADVNAKSINARPWMIFSFWAESGSGGTALHWATGKDVAELLLAHGADVNATDRLSGLTPLHNAAGRGRKELVELLIAHEARTDVRDSKGKTPLGLAVQEGRAAVADLLRQHGAKE